MYKNEDLNFFYKYKKYLNRNNLNILKKNIFICKSTKSIIKKKKFIKTIYNSIIYIYIILLYLNEVFKLIKYLSYDNINQYTLKFIEIEKIYYIYIYLMEIYKDLYFIKNKINISYVFFDSFVYNKYIINKRIDKIYTNIFNNIYNMRKIFLFENNKSIKKLFFNLIARYYILKRKKLKKKFKNKISFLSILYKNIFLIEDKKNIFKKKNYLYYLIVTPMKQNIFATICTKTGRLITYYSSGILNFKGRKKLSSYTTETVGYEIAKKIDEKKIRKLDIIVKLQVKDSNLTSFFQGFTNYFIINGIKKIRIYRFFEIKKEAHNGVRGKKKRRK